MDLAPTRVAVFKGRIFATSCKFAWEAVAC